mmetsp:Transcript_14280/g.36622  ORF Transcript_14280/g.36622 Transcript_14280/m.36622 type:complete len:228 (+) Transcript_14280:610-1293(+)
MSCPWRLPSFRPGHTLRLKCSRRASAACAMGFGTRRSNSCCTCTTTDASTPRGSGFHLTAPACDVKCRCTNALISGVVMLDSSTVCRYRRASPLSAHSRTRIMSAPCCSDGTWLRPAATVDRWLQFCINITSARSMTRISTLERKSLASGWPSWRALLSSSSRVTTPSGDAAMMSACRKSAVSTTDPRVSLMPSMKWSSVLPPKRVLYSGGFSTLRRPPSSSSLSSV